jgi:hypothetical protein
MGGVAQLPDPVLAKIAEDFQSATSVRDLPWTLSEYAKHRRDEVSLF